jgi:hypothetical protein
MQEQFFVDRTTDCTAISEQTFKEMYLRLAAFAGPSNNRKQLRKAILVRALKVMAWSKHFFPAIHCRFT